MSSAFASKCGVYLASSICPSISRSNSSFTQTKFAFLRTSALSSRSVSSSFFDSLLPTLHCIEKDLRLYLRCISPHSSSSFPSSRRHRPSNLPYPAADGWISRTSEITGSTGFTTSCCGPSSTLTFGGCELVSEAAVDTFLTCCYAKGRGTSNKYRVCPGSCITHKYCAA